MEESPTAVLVYHNTVSILPGSRVFKVKVILVFFLYLYFVQGHTLYCFFLHVSQSSHMVHPLITINTIIKTKTKPLLL